MEGFRREKARDEPECDERAGETARGDQPEAGGGWNTLRTLPSWLGQGRGGGRLGTTEP